MTPLGNSELGTPKPHLDRIDFDKTAGKGKKLAPNILAKHAQAQAAIKRITTKIASARSSGS